MEHSPITAETDAEAEDDKEGSGKKKKKSAEALGAFLIEPEKARKPERERAAASEKKPEADKESDKADAETDGEAQLEELSGEEVRHIEREIVMAEPSLEILPEADDAEQAAIEAIEAFRARIIEEAQPADDAMEETLAEFAPDVAPGEFAEASPEVAETEPGHAEEAIVFDRAAERASAAGEEGEPESSDSDGGSGRPPVTSGSGAMPPFGPQFNQETIPGIPAPSRAEREERQEPEYHDASPAAMALVGGIIGYLIGRRRGRIKTERKLKPIQRKLEKQVVDLQEKLRLKEEKIRLVVRRQVQEHQRVERNLKRAEQRPATVEARRLRTQKPPAERIGHVLVEAEQHARPAPVPEKLVPGTQEERVVEKRVETMTRGELLQLSDRIIVEGSTLRQIYETHLVGERGLRRLVGEYLRGGDMKKRLRQEIVEREIDFERDPVMRDRSAQTGGDSGASLQSMLKKAGQSLPAESEEVAFYKARAAFESQQQVRQQSRRRVIDVSLATAIAVLGAVIIILLLKR